MTYRLGSSASVQPPRLWRTESIGEPIVEFIFRYRPLGSAFPTPRVAQVRLLTMLVDLLRANGIVPLPTPQSNQPSPRGSATPLAHNDPNPRDDMQENDEIRELEVIKLKPPVAE
jgi:hypothetical protein